MNMLLTSILSIIFSTLAAGQGTSSCHLCEFSGLLRNNNYTFSISDLPDRCNEVVYGFYFFDEEDKSTTFNDVDKNAVRALVAAGLTVYLRVGFVMGEPWTDILDPKDSASYDKLICPFMDFINELEITGILLGFRDILDGSNYAKKINEFITKLKTNQPTLKFGVQVEVSTYFDKLSNKEVFDFTACNSVVDVYIVVMSLDKICPSGNLITSADVATIEKISSAVAQSPMDQNKTFARVIITVLLKDDSDGSAATYGAFCSGSDSEVCKLCADSSQTLYDKGKTIKPYFHGITAAWLEDDDTKSVCCAPKKFPATNIVFDGWDSVPFTPCQKFDIKK